MISNRTHYALKAMLELSLRHRQGPVTIGHIADAQGIPARFLEAILRQLKQAGLADSARGKEGGYYLVREPHTINMGQVIQLFEGPLIGTGGQGGEVPDVFAPAWTKAEDALNRVLDQTDFATLVEQELNRANILATNFTI